MMSSEISSKPSSKSDCAIIFFRTDCASVSVTRDILSPMALELFAAIRYVIAMQSTSTHKCNRSIALLTPSCLSSPSLFFSVSARSCSLSSKSSSLLLLPLRFRRLKNQMSAMCIQSPTGAQRQILRTGTLAKDFVNMFPTMNPTDVSAFERTLVPA